MNNLNYLKSMTDKSVYLLFFTLLLLGCGQKEGEVFKLLDTEKSGIDFSNKITETDDLNILDYLYFYNGGGVAIGDINNDGLPDIYFSGNQVKNKLYLNKGNLQFEDISISAGVEGNSDWNTGVVMGDVNGDGLLDIYVCAVVGINGFNGHNELFINNGDATFTESSAKYGLDFENYSTTAAFLDYDLDGDLDIYLLNHAVHNQESFGKASIRNNRSYESGDKLLRNNGNSFEDVSEQAGIFGGANGYGLGVAVADFNNDGYPDIYVGNDFHEDDYYYLNNGDGTFSESLKQYFGHTSRFSMGNDVADINHDGFPDIMTLDMLPSAEKILKSTVGDENVSMLNMRINELGYHYQFSRNMLQLNNGGNSFTEVALQSGVAATDWSWSALFNDYNQDGEQDLFISNGIPKRPNDLDYVNFVSNEQIQKKLNNTKLIDNEALKLMPSGAVQNYIFQGSKNLKFLNKSDSWIPKDSVISNGTAYGDLDNDGDLDIVTNNLNAKPSFYINKTNGKASYLKLKFTFEKMNVFGIGTKAIAYSNGSLQSKELYTARGFESSSEPIIHFGFGDKKIVDSLEIIWPNKTKQVFKNIPLNQTLQVKYDAKKTISVRKKTKIEPLFKKVEGNLGINFKHNENYAVDSDVQKLIPYNISDRGIATTIADIDNDGKVDVLFGGSNRENASIYLQKDGFFEKDSTNSLWNESIYEDVAFIVKDFNGDKKTDVFALSGGGLFSIKSAAMQDRFYIQNENEFVKSVIPEYFKNGMVAKEADFDNDGDLDIFIGGGAVPNDFGKAASSYILINTKGNFNLLNCKALTNIGMVTDAIWTDFDQDGLLDLIVIGEWMSPKFLKNTKTDFVDVSKEKLQNDENGLWQSIISFDIDHDGDEDYLLGNWGLNTKFKASYNNPMQLFYGDFDNNSKLETIIAIEKNGNYYTLANLDELAGQLVGLTKKKFPKYKDFAGKTLYEVFDKALLDKGIKLAVNNLQSGYLQNNKGVFSFVPFDRKLQVAPITTFLKYDFNGDKIEEVLAGGNYFGVSPFQGRFDGFPGALIINPENIVSGNFLGLNFMGKEVKKLNILTFNNKQYLLVTINNNNAEIYEIKN
jgi:hypothetical protein